MTDPVLQVSDLCKRFGALVACHQVRLDLMPGEIHALIGPNGAGKSTLIKQITGELSHDAGSLRFLGKDIGHLDMVSRARLGLARTFQVSTLAQELSVLQNVMLAVMGRIGGAFRFFRSAGQDRKLTEPAMHYLARVGLEDRARERTSDLSHGERRKLEIAIALAMRPRAFLLDEPMAGLGQTGSQNLTPLLSNLREEAPLLMVEHDMDAVFALADRISVLVSGRIIATGTPAEIRADSQVREAYLGELA